ncbi:MAG: tetratricopeptide repeat-containing serine/threonine-protein kinase, partial [Acidobacteriota bacterium]|nr:tetratricopeptide repeat-containing serine/threonine-protein kinase [Acidobacteriota bacterium]
MTPERWKQVEEVFQAALDFPIERREAFLDEACGDDAALRQQVEALVDSHDSAGSFIEAPAFAGANYTKPDEPTGVMNGRRVGSYKIVREIGRGGMGAVYLAARDDEMFQKRVAIKLVKRGMDTDFILRRFRHERQILANLDHPNIARLLDGGTTDDNLPYFVMEYVEGQPIHHYCDADKLSIAERLRLFRRVCAAVAYAHRNQIIHRDIKPGNILVTGEGTPKLLDFGIAKLLNPELASDTFDPTQTALRLMTPEYASPEQVRGLQVTTATDTYSLGVLLYEILSGHRPYPPLSRIPHELSRVISEENPERPSAVVGHADGILMTGAVKSLGAAANPEVIGRCRGNVTLDALRREIAGNLDNIVLKAMCKDPSSRYASVDDFSEDIRRHLDGLPVVAPSCDPLPDKAFDSAAREATTLEKSIAVLPLKMLHPARSEDTGDNYLGLGLADAVITRLSNIRRINVRPTSSVLKYSSGDDDPFIAGKELGVGYVLDGRIQRIGERIRVTVQLVSMRDGAPLWASRFDEKYTDILSLEDSLSAQVAEALIPRLTGEERERLGKRGTDNPEAFEAYLRGRYHWNTYTEEGLAKAIVYFNEAIAIDSSYAAAHAGVADYFNWLGVYGVLPARECFVAAREAAARAVELDGTLAEAYASLAFTVWAYDWDWAESERLFKRAVELNPNYSQAHEWYSHVLGSQGRHPEAVGEMRRAIELNPQSAALAAMFAFTLHNSRDYREGTAQLRRALDIEPNNHLALQGFGWMHEQGGTSGEALAATEKAVELSGRTHLTLWT